MSLPRHIRQYWPLTIVTIAVVSGLPLLTSQGEHRPGLVGITGRTGGLSADADDLLSESSRKRQSGYTRPAGMLPFYGFDNLTLATPIFKSWWDGRSSVAGSKLKELNANTVILGPIWKDSLKFHDMVARFHGSGVKIIVQVTDVEDWVDLRDDGTGRFAPVPNTFVSGRAAHTLTEAKNQGVGRFADFILVGGDAMSYANQLQRQKMYEVVKQYFPNTPIVRRYGVDLERAESMTGKPHPMGGTWDGYCFGPDEVDIALVTIGRGVDEGRVGVRVNAALEQLNHVVSIVKSRHNDAAVIVTSAMSDDGLMNNSRMAMWSSKEIDQFVSAMLTSAGVDGLLMRGLGQFAYDIGAPEFVAQRQAFKDAAPVVNEQQQAASVPVTMERSPASK